ncbi:hypothetical protein BE61_20250 [Bradyrhizobium elkanii USDA 61]|nr:hypothetical protein BE61_20250 [Bradyrhizobium elkanii USDA 61]GEC59104.1 hypothetical protein BEL01nite_81470 [Bradyrhizobium elkanii]
MRAAADGHRPHAVAPRTGLALTRIIHKRTKPYLAQQPTCQTVTLRREADGALSYLVQTDCSRERRLPDPNVMNRTRLNEIRRAALVTTRARDDRADRVLVYNDKLAGLHAKS